MYESPTGELHGDIQSASSPSATTSEEAPSQLSLQDFRELAFHVVKKAFRQNYYGNGARVRLKLLDLEMNNSEREHFYNSLDISNYRFDKIIFDRAAELAVEFLTKHPLKDGSHNWGIMGILLALQVPQTHALEFVSKLTKHIHDKSKSS